MAKKKDFSGINTSPLYEMQDTAITPLPGQTYLEGTEPGKIEGMLITNPEDAPSEELLEELLESGAVLPDDKQADYEELIKRAKARREQAARDVRELKAAKAKAERQETLRNKPRTGKISLHAYLSAEHTFYLEMRANFTGKTKQQILAEMIQKEIDNDPTFAEMWKLKQQAEKGRQ